MKSTGSNDKFRLDCASGSYHNNKTMVDNIHCMYAICKSNMKYIQPHAKLKKKSRSRVR